MKRFLVAGSLALLSAPAASAFAQSYPARPIRILVGFAPGGAADITARLLGEKFTASMGANVVVDNRTGATGRPRAVNRVPACGM
jgi:tripartite-type tricarboxylate transporter receptor subunit TctC